MAIWLIRIPTREDSSLDRFRMSIYDQQGR